MPTKDNYDIAVIINRIQRYLLWIFVIVLPVSILPFPWDYTERGMSIVILLVTLLIIGLELVKIIWSGKISFLKRDVDLILFALLISLTLTTVFASDINLSLFSYNYRLGEGFLSIVAVLLVTFVARGFISTKQQLLTLLNTIFVGSLLASLVSIISLFGGNIFGLIPKLSSLGITGYPILGDPVILSIYNCMIIFLAYSALNIYGEQDVKDDYSWFSVVVIFMNLVSLVLISVHQSAFFVVILFVSLWIITLLILGFKDKKNLFKNKIAHFILPVIILILSIIMQFDSVSKFVFGDTELISSVKLSINFSWQIVSASLTNSLRNGILGLGLDSFGVAFTALKPIELMDYNFLSAYNEVLTSLSNAGFLWLIIWLVLGWYVLKDLIADIKEYGSKSEAIVFFDVIVLFLYLTSFLTTYTILLRFLFFLGITLNIVLRNLYKQHEVNNMVLKIWSMNIGENREGNTSITQICLTGLTVVVIILGAIKLGNMTLSGLYILRAESYVSEENDKYSESGEEISLEDEEEIIDNLYRWYQLAVKYDRRNPLVNRKFSTVAVDKLSILMEKYEDTEDEDILSDAVELRKQAFEYSRIAINLSPSLYSSYDSRAEIYLGIINLGYTEYIRDAISVIDEAIDINPYDYGNYYNKGWLYYLLQNYDLALESSTQALSIRGDYIEALLLSANINGIQGKTEIQLSYLEAVKTILEENDYQGTELYNSLVEQIELIESEASEEE